MKKSCLSAAGALIGALLFAGPVAAQSPADYRGEWKLAFTSESSSSEPNLKPAPWITFTATVVQVDSTIGGAMRSDGPSGQFGCRLREGACTAGRMRLSWDDQEWQVFHFKLESGSATKGAGRAEIRYPDGQIHKYTFVISRP